MKYVLFASEDAAKAASAAEATRRGCEPGTEYWWGWLVGPEGQAVLLIPLDQADSFPGALDELPWSDPPGE